MSRTPHIRLILPLAAAGALALGAVVPSSAASLDAGAGDVVDDAAALDDAPLGPLNGTRAQASGAASHPRAAGDPLVGTFGITAGTCSDAGVTSGSYFRMATPAGDTDDGPWVDNSSSPCGDDSWTPLSPGTDGGLSTAGYQPHPDPAFDGNGNARADRVIEPTTFFGTDFSAATSPVDPQTEEDVPVPVIEDSGGDLSGQVTAWGAAWNNQDFNQGSPKPDGSTPGGTFGPTGTYDPTTGAYSLEWASLIVGGPFDGFTGLWHLEGTFEPAPGANDGSTTSSTNPGGSSGAGPGTGSATSGSPDADATDARATGSGNLPRTGGPAPAAMALVLAGLSLAVRRLVNNAASAPC